MNDNGAARLVPVKKVSVTEMITAQIIAMIEDGTLKPGDKLPPQKQLEKQLNVSHPSLREAMTGLVMLGHIESRVGSGYFVRNNSAREVIDYATIANMIDNNNISGLFEARMFFEASTVALAAKRATKADLEKIYQFLDQIDAEIRTTGVQPTIGLGFHQMVADCCHNPVLSYIEGFLLKLFKEYAEKIYGELAVYEFDVEAHRRIVDAIARNDSQKAYEMSVRDIRDYLTTVGANQELDNAVDLTRLPL